MLNATASQIQSTAELSGRCSLGPLPSPAVLRQRLPLSAELAGRIHEDREQIRAVLDGRDDRLRG